MLPAWLVDESTGGFAVLVSSVGMAIMNQRIELRTDGMCFDVRVMHVTEVTPRISVSGKGPWFRLGLRCLNEIDLAEPSDCSVPTKKAKSLRATAGNWGTNRVVLAVAVVTVILSVGVAVACRMMR